MPEQILVQPNGRLAVFSTVSGTFVIADATDEEVVDRAAETAARLARPRTTEEIRRARDGTQSRSALTWEAALEENRIHGGDLFREPCPSCGHGYEIHSDDGCWFTVTAGRPEKNAVCQCRIRRDGTDPLEVKQ